MDVDEKPTTSPSSSSLTSSSTGIQVPIATQRRQQNNVGVQTSAQDTQGNECATADDNNPVTCAELIAPKESTPATRPISELTTTTDAGDVAGHAKTNIAVGEFNNVERRAIKVGDDDYEQGFDSDGELGPFFDAVEDESSDDDSSVESNLPPDFARDAGNDDSVGSNVFEDANDELPPLDTPLIDSDCVAPESVPSPSRDSDELKMEAAMAVKVAESKEVRRASELPLGGKKKESQDRLKAKLDDGVHLVLKATTQQDTSSLTTNEGRKSKDKDKVKWNALKPNESNPINVNNTYEGAR